MLFIKNQNGNIFFTLFGAVAIIGLLGTVIVSTMRGPLSTMVEVQARTQAESEMAIASRLALLEATELASDGDCDGDGFVEPLEYQDAGASDAPVGGGYLPNAVASAHLDPWGTEYGYCAWDAGSTTGAIACDTSGNTTNERLDGNGSITDETYTVIAVISAGADQVFGTTCVGGANPSITKTGDDIVVEYTYATATAASGGLWNIKSGDPSVAEISKDIEVTGGASFTAGIDLTTSSAALQLGAASMLFPNEITLSTCNAANDGLVRVNTASDPDYLQLCDDPNGWVAISGSAWSAGAANDIYYNTGTYQVGIGTTTPAEALDVVGNIIATGNITAGGGLFSVGLTSTGNATIGGTFGVTGATTLTTLNATGAVDFDSALNVDGDSTLVGALGVTGASTLTTLNATGAVDFDSTLNVDGDSTLVGALGVTGASTITTLNATGAVDFDSTLNVDGDISDSNSAVTINDDLSVTGDINATNITASATLNAGTTVNVNGDQLGPALNCAAAQKLLWTNGAGWSCGVDLQGGGGGGLPDFEDVLTADNNANGLNAVNLGQVAIGNATPRAELDVNEGDFLVSGTYTGTSAVPVSGAGTRMFFQPATSAFRAGTVTGTQWDDGSIGDYSVAFGSSTTASGDYSVAFGEDVNVSALNSFGIGLGSVAGAVPTVSGNSSFGIFMGDQSGIDITAPNTLSLMGGTMAIGSVAASTGGVQDLELDVTGDIGADNYCDASGNNCFVATDVGATGSGVWEIVSNTTRVKSTAGDYASDDFLFGSTQLNDTTNPDHDSRMFFDKSKSAFRAGTVTGTQWDDGNIGDYSVAFGYNTTASGDYSAAMGLGLSAGAAPIVSGDSSFGIFMGDQSGVDITANNTMALMGGAMAIGSVAASTGGVQDLELDVTGDIGADNYCDAAGNNCFVASSVGGASLSSLTIASATNTLANTNYAQVWNWDTLTTETAMTLGSTSITSGNILGINSSATAFTGTMVDITLSGNNASNIGTVLKSSVTGASSVAVPLMVTNLGVGASFRVNDETGDTDASPFIIDASGNVGIGTATPTTALDINGVITATSSAWDDDGGGSLQIVNSSTAGAGITMKPTSSATWEEGWSIYAAGSTGWPGNGNLGFIAHNNGGGTNSGDVLMVLTRSAQLGIGTRFPNVALDVIGSIEYTGTITDVSDRRLKANIKPLNNITDRLTKIDTYSFTMKDDKIKRIEFGVMAQELEEIFPELVHTANDEIGTKSVNYIGLIAPIIEATKELYSENIALKSEIEELKANQTKMYEIVGNLSKEVKILNKPPIKEYMILIITLFISLILGYRFIVIKPRA